MSPRSLIVVTVDGLCTSALEPYGCSWLETPGMNRLAAKAILLDRAIATSLDRDEVLEGYLGQSAAGVWAGAVASDRQMPSLLLTDSDAAAGSRGAKFFDECTLVGSEDRGGSAAEIAESPEETLLGRLFAEALMRRETLGASPNLVWIHASSLLHTWDAPHAFRDAEDLLDEAGPDEYPDPETQFDTENDPDDEARRAAANEAVRQICEQTSPPRLWLADDEDPDVLLAWMTLYGAQVRVLDLLLEVLLDILQGEPDTALVLASTSGFALGEHGWIGADAGPTRSPRIQLPQMIWDPQRSPAHPSPARILRPVASDRLGATIIELLSGGAHPIAGHSLMREAEPDSWAEPLEPMRPVLSTAAPGRSNLLALKTAPGWFYIREEEDTERLFLKPDDRNDANDIAKLEPRVLDQFR